MSDWAILRARIARAAEHYRDRLKSEFERDPQRRALEEGIEGLPPLAQRQRKAARKEAIADERLRRAESAMGPPTRRAWGIAAIRRDNREYEESIAGDFERAVRTHPERLRQPDGVAALREHAVLNKRERDRRQSVANEVRKAAADKGVLESYVRWERSNGALLERQRLFGAEHRLDRYLSTHPQLPDRQRRRLSKLLKAGKLGPLLIEK